MMFCLCLLFDVSILYRNPRRSGDEFDSVRGQEFLIEKIVRQVCLDGQRFNVNTVMYSTFLIRGVC